MQVVGIIGNRGAGKTCLMTDLLYKDYKAGRKVIANYHLKFPVVYMSFEKVATLPEELQDATLGFDELGIGADSRAFFSKRNSKISKLVTQIRKRKCLLYYTVQRFNLIDKRIREQTDYFILMEAKKAKGVFIGYVLDGGTGDNIRRFVFYGHKAFGLYDTNEIIDFEEEE